MSEIEMVVAGIVATVMPYLIGSFLASITIFLTLVFHMVAHILRFKTLSTHTNDNSS